MWIKYEKMVRKSVIFATICWTLTLLGFYGIVATLKDGQLDFLIASFLVLMVLGGIVFTRQAVEHAKGIFVSDREISLPGLFRRKRLIAQEIEKNNHSRFSLLCERIAYQATSSVFLFERETNSYRCEFLVPGEEKGGYRFDQAILSPGGSDGC